MKEMIFLLPHYCCKMSPCGKIIWLPVISSLSLKSRLSSFCSALLRWTVFYCNLLAQENIRLRQTCINRLQSCTEVEITDLQFVTVRPNNLVARHFFTFTKIKIELRLLSFAYIHSQLSYCSIVICSFKKI